MLNSEKLAIAAHLHVLLRRKTGRVTDTEWMASNTEYAAEIIRFARAAAKDDGHADLGEWAAKLELAMEPQHPHRATSRDKLFGMLGGNTRPAPLPGASDSLLGAADAGGHRYIRGIR
ncbi:hypothetical protein os4_05300 [Comamonadaceae bacterium OS-4]|jgi:hypothetical protein|uniref:Uncharacterized protein n=1 Tax=Rhodoferax potami TaxID=3068338 RepID=A0ABU3KMH1_9BURK|nr:MULTISPECIES: hypothetical protein [unclassified Rhodoferax]MDT7518459.1 hypothetical protein [Rhodoferax sp. TBRC 17660]MDT7524308.1 hypothetical protein [Rhodoferax sp. TBRC 17198]BDT71017.1 hypothetical protein os4_05300 [Comamonadaceae bacterium OS-4]